MLMMENLEAEKSHQQDQMSHDDVSSRMLTNAQGCVTILHRQAGRSSVVEAIDVNQS